MENNLRKRHYRVCSPVVSSIVICFAQLSEEYRCQTNNAPRAKTKDGGEHVQERQAVSKRDRNPGAVNNYYDE